MDFSTCELIALWSIFSLVFGLFLGRVIKAGEGK